jgi:hypothetical protein
VSEWLEEDCAFEICSIRWRFGGSTPGMHSDWDMVYDTLYIELEYKSLKNGQKASRNDTPYSPA